MHNTILHNIKLALLLRKGIIMVKLSRWLNPKLRCKALITTHPPPPLQPQTHCLVIATIMSPFYLTLKYKVMIKIALSYNKVKLRTTYFTYYIRSLSDLFYVNEELIKGLFISSLAKVSNIKSEGNLKVFRSFIR